MADDDLDTPLGLDRRRADRREIPWRGLAIGGIGIVAASLVAFVFVTGNGMGGEPFATTSVETKKAPPTPPNAHVVVSSNTIDETPTASIAKTTDDNNVTIENGVRVVRGGSAGTSGAQVIRIPDGAPARIHLNPAPDRRLVDKGRYGPLPKIGADGAKPLAVYNRPVDISRGLPSDAPRIAILIGGMGLNPAETRAAIEKLPGAVTLGFAPYGSNLDAQVAHARDNGHEIVLQMPMEGFGESESSGPHLLSTAQTKEQNLDDMYWLMSRFTGYAGTANFLGAKFTGDAASFGPVLQEIGARGLYYLDDGTSPRSLAASLAASEGAPVLRADIVFDSIDQPDAIVAALEKLAALAQQKGNAIGVATGLPTTVDAADRFARNLKQRGIALVPLSAMINHSAPAVASGP
ncbi:MAG TPA: divergent polysaccharide deacetylase family protein [Beijerinckiaceae bacterium]|nr:divergent polysaccharide deacetylase family protein [Beijerinckiaceae bacterium]